jgi:Asp-tRNA(Asn)/Glu-tRNA(Gln) amidotransferase C subunit
MTTVTTEEILHLAKLCALHLEGKEIEPLRKDIEGIVWYVSLLQEIDTEGVQPLAHPIQDVVSPLYTGSTPYTDPDWLLSNVEHPINHRQIVITSKKAEEE